MVESDGKAESVSVMTSGMLPESATGLVSVKLLASVTTESRADMSEAAASVVVDVDESKLESASISGSLEESAVEFVVPALAHPAIAGPKSVKTIVR